MAIAARRASDRLLSWNILIRIEAKLDLILEKETKIMSAIDDIQADVTKEDTVIDSVMVLLTQLATEIANAGVDPAKLAALRADIQNKTAALAAAVAANTPTAPAP